MSSHILLARGMVVAAGLLIGGCVDNLAICIDSGAAVIVQVSDAITGEALTAGSVGVITDGMYADSLRIQGGEGEALSLVAGSGRPGRYDVTVLHPGYQPWHATNVVAATSACGVAGAVLRANLIRLP